MLSSKEFPDFEKFNQPVSSRKNTWTSSIEKPRGIILKDAAALEIFLRVQQVKREPCFVRINEKPAKSIDTTDPDIRRTKTKWKRTRVVAGHEILR